MRIIAGFARNLELFVPPTLEIRPTVGRARKALFDSLGDFSGLRVVDLFSGSGALALEAASRGASSVICVEQNSGHGTAITENSARVKKAGAEFTFRLLLGDAGNPNFVVATAPCDVLFADPPYRDSSRYFRNLMKSEKFREAMKNTKVVWEIPDYPGAAGEFLEHAPSNWGLRKFGATLFLLGVMP